MANDMLKQTESESETVREIVESHQLDAFLGRAFEDKPLWTDLWESIRDLFFPVKLPPLQLESTPIPVPDRMAQKPNPWAYGISATFNGLLLLLVLILVGRKIIETVKPQILNTPIDLSEPKLGGGGGGKPLDKPKVPDPKPPKIVVLQQPKIVQPKIDLDQKIEIETADQTVPLVGTGAASVVLGAGGSGGGIGGGNGPGIGNGYGPGVGGGTGGGLYQVGKNVSAPVPLFTPEAEFSDEARRAKYQGVCIVGLIVDVHGDPQNVHVVRALGMGLDEKALEAVRKYKFKPAMKDNKTPVPVAVNVEVNFRLY